jgi:hypothetical protein
VIILVDTDVLMLDLRYPRDRNYAVNRRALDQIRADGIDLVVTVQVLLELVGKLSFGTAASKRTRLPLYLCGLYRLIVVPDLKSKPDYAACTVQEVVDQMSMPMSLGDAVQAVQIAKYASSAHCLLTWNARHFRNKMVIPVLTPEEWLNQRAAGTP